MDEEREKGRIAGLRTRRLATAEWASKLIPVLDQARKELPDQDGGGPSLLAYATWLNEHGYTSRRGKRWRAETVSRLFEIHISLIEEAEKEFAIASAVINFKLKHAMPELRDALAAEHISIKDERTRLIMEARSLAANLKGHSVEELVSPPVNPERHRVALKREQNPPIEVQLKLI